ncbi:hypothetical protein NE237_032328 [Protea cynaroides]|uniref:Uncharacterized protein n=1 Tax=Protea cynaroides TaxID=273540 RepID=A0A9Q0L3A1_9MAGN|nr:hypothetical protein NE237_032328 [Protea cynaroides]
MDDHSQFSLDDGDGDDEINEEIDLKSTYDSNAERVIEVSFKWPNFDCFASGKASGFGWSIEDDLGIGDMKFDFVAQEEVLVATRFDDIVKTWFEDAVVIVVPNSDSVDDDVDHDNLDVKTLVAECNYSVSCSSADNKLVTDEFQVVMTR